MEYFVAFLVVVWCAILMFLIIGSLETLDPVLIFCALMWLVIGLGSAIEASSKADESGPCIEWATGVSMVGKVATPYRYCKNRGEWLTEEKG